MWHRIFTLAVVFALSACANWGGEPSRSATEESAVEGLGAELFAAPLTEAKPLEASSPTALAPVAILPPGNAWQHYQLPGKQASKFRAATHEGRKGVKASAQSSASMLRYKLRVASQDLAAMRFSWKVPRLIQDADLADRDLDDAPVRVVLAFEGDRSKFSARNAMLSELSHALTGEPMPYATLMYVWCNTRTPGTVVNNPRTDRIRKMVVESGGKNLNRWMDYERDIRADFIKAFGEEPGALLGVALMTDTDNTRSETTAWYGPVSLGNAQGGMVTKALQK
jgi:Protein of unknown function (DUF3047)